MNHKEEAKTRSVFQHGFRRNAREQRRTGATLKGGKGMSVLQAILIALIAAVSRCEGDWLGECKLREPIVTGFLVGLALGDVKTGLIIGA